MLGTTSYIKGLLMASSATSDIYNNDNVKPGQKIPLVEPIPDNPVIDSCFLYADALNNTGSGHSNSITTWTNLISGQKNGTKVGTCSWQNNRLATTSGGFKFMTKQPTTGSMECVFETTSSSATGQQVLCTAESGGISFSLYYPIIAMYKKIPSSYVGPEIRNVVVNKKIYVCGTWTSTKSNLIAVIDGKTYKASVDVSGRFVTSSAPWSIGYNPDSYGAYQSEPFKGYIYSARVHTRVLTDEEIRTNYLYEKNRYEL